MKTQAYIDELVKIARFEWVKEHREFKSAIDTLESIYDETINGKPADTIDLFVAAVGILQARAVIATLVNRSAWDGRLSKRVTEWAAHDVFNAFDEKAATEHGYYTNRIHMAHLDQLAAEIMKRGRKESE